MPKPYSYDLRQKVIQAIKLDGLKISEASILFSISCNTIGLWLKRQTETGDFLALPNQPRGNGHKIDEIKRQAFVTELSTIPSAQIVYVDESGMDNRDQYDYGWNPKGQRFHALKSFSA